jgi:2-polyprenyl-6-methoxyphenol hydroxylase-like FAD-dependent oxidoreductase
MMLSLLLARAGVRVTLLEAHQDFDRDFRGDMVHPSTLEVLDQVGLADRLHELPHTRMRELRFVSPTGVHRMAVFTRLPTRFPYVIVMPQARFLEFLAAEAARYPHFRLVMGARVEELLEAGGAVSGVRYRDGGEWREVEAPLTVGTDGRFSRLRKLAALEPVSQSAPMEVIWFRLPREPRDQHDGASLNFGPGHVLVVLARVHEWQVGCIVPKGGYKQLQTEGLAALHGYVSGSLPWLADRVGLLRDWQQVKVLSVEASRLPRWHRPGLLLIGDAAHVMLPVGGVGINCAVADAVEAANVLAGPLREGGVRDQHLAEVQRRREGLTRLIQRFQAVMQKRVVGQALTSSWPFRPPLPLRLVLQVPGLRNLPGRVMAFGVRRARLERPEEVVAGVRRS